MRKIKPTSALALILAFAGLVLGAGYVTESLAGKARYERVRPSPQGEVRIDVSDLEKLDARYYRFLNPGNQEVLFFIARDETGTLQVAFDAGDSHYKTRRGFSIQNGWVVDNKCERANRLSSVNEGGGGCKPTPLAHRVVGDEIVLSEDEVLRGWRYFR